MFGDPALIYLDIRPQSYGPEQRLQAAVLASEKGRGLRMEVHSSHTEFYAAADVPIGKVEIHCALSYKAWPEYVTTLGSADDFWETPLDRERRERLSRHSGRGS